MSDNMRMEVLWGVKLLDDGFTSIPNLIIRNYRRLGIEHGEFGFLCQLLTYKHDTRDPYPSRDDLASHLCCSTRQIDKWVKSLRDKGMILTGRRKNVHNKQWGNTVYNFKPLLDAALNLTGDQPLPDAPVDFDVIWDDEKPREPQVRMEPNVPQVRMGSEPQVRMVSEPEVRTKITIKNNNKKDDCLIDPSREIAASLESETEGIIETLKEHSGWMMVDNHRSMKSEPRYIPQIYLMLLKQFEHQLDAAIAATACELYKDRSYDWINGCMRIQLDNPVAFFNSCYKDAVKAYKAGRKIAKL